MLMGEAFEEQKREKSPSECTCPTDLLCPEDRSGASPILWSHGVGDFFPVLFCDCTVVSDGWGFWKGSLTAGQRGRDFLQPVLHRETFKELWSC